MSVDTTTKGWRLELTRFAPFKRLVQHRGFQILVILPNLFFFVLVILTGLIGTPVGSRNFSIIFVWIVWWALLIVFLIPFGARVWCTICPIPAPGEWLQRLSIVRKGKEMPLSVTAHGWPKRFKNIWLQNGAFLGVALFSAIILTRPLATSLVLLAFILLAIGLSLKFGKRVFCRYVCPVGGFIGLYSMVAPVEIRVRDPKICLSHKEKECIQGSERGYGCPWVEYPGNMVRNTYCGMCTECLKTCTKDNIAINARPFGSDLWVAKGRGLDEAYKAFYHDDLRARLLDCHARSLGATQRHGEHPQFAGVCRVCRVIPGREPGFHSGSLFWRGLDWATPRRRARGWQNRTDAQEIVD